MKVSLLTMIFVLMAISLISNAMTQEGLVALIKIKCDLSRNSPFEEYEEKCMLRIVNCAVRESGKIDVKDIDICVDKRKRGDLE